MLTTNSPHTGSFSTRRKKDKQHLCSLLLLICALIAVGPATAPSQITTKVASVSPSSASVKQPLILQVSLQQGETIEKVFLVYRPFGSSDYERVEMDIVGNTASTTISAQDVLPPFIEYYIVLQDRSGKLESYPLSESSDPFEIPPGKTLQLPVSAEAGGDAQIIFLTPDAGGRIGPGDLLISISLLRADTLVVRRATQILLDGADISKGAVLNDDIVVVSPENMGLTVRPGPHKLTVRLFNREGKLHRSAAISFTVIGSSISPVETSEWRYKTSVQLESRHEDVSSVGTWYNRGNVMFSGSLEEWRFNASTFVTSDEKPDRQPQDRFFASVESPWLRVGYGDAYPSFPNLVLSGKRVRGLVSALKLGWFNVDLTLGKTTRAIEGSLLQVIPRDSLAAAQQQDPNAAYAPIDSTQWGKFSYGTYNRNLFAVRPSFGSGEDWQVGFTWLKSTDDTNSIRYGIRPQENLVLASDFVVRLDEKKIELSGQGAFSAFNSDISHGNITDAQIRELFPNDTSAVKKARDILEHFITVNENLRPLKLNKPSTMAAEAALTLNYFDNALKLTYLFRGSDYNSFGQTFLRNDIRGFNITDRVRLLENQLFATASTEFLKDNTSETKAATTSFANLNFAVSYYPGVEYPTTTVGFALYTSRNYLSLDSLSAVDDATNRFFLQSSYDFELSARHTATFNLSTSNRDDMSPRHYNVKNVTVMLGLVTRYSVPLQTNVDLSINTNSLPKSATQDSSGTFNYTTLSLGARYAIVRDLLSVMASASPTFGDFERTAYDATVEWTIVETMTAALQFTLYNNHGFSSDRIWSLRYRYDL